MPRIILIFCLLFMSFQTFAFYELQGDQSSLDMRGLVRVYGQALEFPDNPFLYPDKRVSGVAGLARIMLDGKINKQWGFEVNAYQTYVPESLLISQLSATQTTGVERSAILENSFSDNDFVQFDFDRLALRWSGEKIDLTLGRQAINLATTFYFTPNDFFAPFAAQTFYRVYKPGVDALRAEISLGDFSQLSLISVMGYHFDNNSDTGWSDNLNSQRDSHLIRWINAVGNVETTLILGRVRNDDVIGFALQGEMFDWLGVRMEGNQSDPRLNDIDKIQQLSIGLEHRWENSLSFQWEMFYNSAGADAVANYQLVTTTTNSSQYLARRYSALGGSYEITPLLIGQAVLISNLVDHSQLVSINTVYSLSDESELVVNLSMPVGDEPEPFVLKSEFGAYPSSLNIEYRIYF